MSWTWTDHIFGIPGMLCSIANQRAGSDGAASEESPIHLVGVSGLADYVLMSMRLSRTFLGVPLVITELMDCPTAASESSTDADGIPASRKRTRRPSSPRAGKAEDADMVLPRSESYFCPEVRLRKVWPRPNGTWAIEETKEVTIEAAPIYHTVPCVGYSLQEPDTAGNLNMDRIRPLFTRDNRAALAREGISPAEKLLQRLKLGERIVLPDGQVMDPADETLITPPHKGRKLVFLGDNSGVFPSASTLAEGADVLVHEATNALTSADVGDSSYADVETKAIGHGHSTPVMTGAFARTVGTRLTALTHFSGRYKAGVAGARVMQEIVDQAEAARRGVVSSEEIMRTVEESLTFGTKNAGRSRMAELVAPLPTEEQAPLSVEEGAVCVQRGRVIAAQDFMTLMLGWKRGRGGDISVEVGADEAVLDFAVRSGEAEDDEAVDQV